MIRGIKGEYVEVDGRPMILMESGDVWPYCLRPHCKNLMTLWAGTLMCHPCSVHELGDIEMMRRYKATRASDGSWNGTVAK